MISSRKVSRYIPGGGLGLVVVTKASFCYYNKPTPEAPTPFRRVDEVEKEIVARLASKERKRVCLYTIAMIEIHVCIRTKRTTQM